MLEWNDGSAFNNVRVPLKIRHVIQGPAGDGGCIQVIDPFGLGATAQCVSQLCGKSSAIGYPLAIFGEPGIFDPLRMANCVGQTSELAVVKRGDQNIAI